MSMIGQMGTMGFPPNGLAGFRETASMPVLPVASLGARRDAAGRSALTYVAEVDGDGQSALAPGSEVVPGAVRVLAVHQHSDS